MRKLHVLIIPSSYPTPYSPASGVFFQDQAKALNKVGFKVGVIYPDLRSLRTIDINALKENHFQKTWLSNEGINILRFSGWNFPSARIRSRLFINNCSSMAKKYINEFGKPDIIHAHCTIWAGVAAMVVSKLYDIPFVITEHSSVFAQNQLQAWQIPAVKRALNSCTSIVCVSNSLANVLTRLADDKKVSVIPNVVDTTFFHTPALPRSTKPFRFLSVAFLNQIKGIDSLIQAFAKSFKGDSDVTLEIGGDGPLLYKLSNLCLNLGVENQIKFLGRLSRVEVRNAMWRSNVLVLPSHKETFGVVLIEAMSTGLPVIATKCGGPEDFVKENFGTLVPVGDVESLAREMIDITKRWERYDSNQMSQYIYQNFGEEAIASRLVKLYESAL